MAYTNSLVVGRLPWPVPAMMPCAEDGAVYTWGRGDDGRLGHGDNGWKYVPRVVEALEGQRIVQVGNVDPGCESHSRFLGKGLYAERNRSVTGAQQMATGSRGCVQHTGDVLVGVLVRLGLHPTPSLVFCLGTDGGACHHIIRQLVEATTPPP